MSGCAKQQATSKALLAEKAKAAAVATRSAASALVDDAAAEVAAAEGAAAEAEAEARPAPHAKAAPRPRPLQAPAPPPEPTSRQKTMEQAKEKKFYKTLEDHVKKLSDQLEQSEREKQELKQAQKATTRG